MSARPVGSLALSHLEHAAGEKFTGSIPKAATALRDLEALVAERNESNKRAEMLDRRLFLSRKHTAAAEADAAALADALADVLPFASGDAFRARLIGILDAHRARVAV